MEVATEGGVGGNVDIVTEDTFVVYVYTGIDYTVLADFHLALDYYTLHYN